MWGEGREVVEMGAEGVGSEGRERKGRSGGEKGKQGLAGAEAKLEVVRLAAGEAQKESSWEVQEATRACFICS